MNQFRATLGFRAVAVCCNLSYFSMAEETNSTARRTRSMLPNPAAPFSSCLLAIEFLSAANGNAANEMVHNGVNEQIAVVTIPPKATRLKRLTMNALHLASKNAMPRGTRSLSKSTRSNADGGCGGGSNMSES